MKKTISMLALAAAVLCSCDKDAECIPCEEGQKTATLSLSLGFEDPATKVTAYTASQDYEKQVNDVQVFLFDADGRINIYRNCGTDVSGITLSTTTGQKTVWAVVNGPDLSSVSSLSALTEWAVDLAANSTDKSKGFLMTGSASCNVLSSGSSATVNVSRLVSRIALQKVTNSIPEGYGAMTIDYVMLINVAGNEKISGGADISTWYNKMGRRDTSSDASHIIDGATYAASCPDLTFAAPGASVAHGAAHTPSIPYLMYCYPNPTTTDANGWSNSFTPRKTRLVMAATIGGTRYFYPVVIDAPARNKAYTVEMNITGLGSTDPDKMVEKGAATISVSVQEWLPGDAFEETI